MFYNSLSSIIFFGFYLTLFIAPVLALLIRKKIKTYRKKLFIFTAVAIGLFLVMQRLGISFVGVVMDVVVFYAIYILLVLCVVQLIGYRSRVIQMVGMASFLAILAITILSLPGFLVVGLAASNMVPKYSVYNDQGYLCRVKLVSRGDHQRKQANLYKVLGIIEYQLQITNKRYAQESNLPQEKLCTSIFSGLKGMSELVGHTRLQYAE